MGHPRLDFPLLTSTHTRDLLRILRITAPPLSGPVPVRDLHPRTILRDVQRILGYQCYMLR